MQPIHDPSHPIAGGGVNTALERCHETLVGLQGNGWPPSAPRATEAQPTACSC